MNEQRPTIEQEMRRAVRYICRGIRSKSVREQAEQEYLEHIEDRFYGLMLQGIPEEKALQMSIDALGSPEELCHMLASVHNRLPADFGKRILFLGIRSTIAVFIGCMLWAFGLFDAHPITLLIPILFITGLTPFRYMRALWLRGKQVRHIRRICQKNCYQIEQRSSPILSVLIPSRNPEWIISTNSQTYCVHFLACHNRRATLHLLDNYVYTLTVTRGQGARFVDRSPFRNNIIRSSDQSYSEQSFKNLYFPLSPECSPGGMRKILLLNPVPSEISYRKGTATEYIGNGDFVFGFTVCDSTYFAQLLTSEKD